MMSVLQRFLGFDRLLGPTLVKLVYYVGAAFLVVGVALAALSGLISIFNGNLGSGLMQLIAAPAVGAVAFVYWRFVCELFMLAFLTYDRLGEIRDRLVWSAPDPNHPAF
jgi:hypothetical protein